MKRNAKTQLHLNKPELPPFLRRMREQMVNNEVKIDDKFQKRRPADERDFEDRDGEQPQVVVLKKGDLSESDYKQAKEEADRRLIQQGKIKFLAPESSSRVIPNKAEVATKSNKRHKSAPEVDSKISEQRLSFGAFGDEDDSDSD